jgi:hypothetical protein
MRHFILLLVLLLTASTSLIAQDDDTPQWLAEGWTYERSCLPEAPTEPPAYWTFEGTLLYRGQYGIHGYRQGWDTTRVMAFIEPQPGNSTATYSLSPDMKQIAVVEGKTDECSTCRWHYIDINQLSVIQLSDQNPHQRQDFPWDLYYPDIYHEGRKLPIIWRDNHTLLFPKAELNAQGDQPNEYAQLLDIRTMTVAPFAYDIPSLRDTFSTLSPDLTLYWQDSELINLVSGNIINSFQSTLFNFSPRDLFSGTDLWSPDSSQFMAFIRESENSPYSLTVLDRNGATRIPVAQVDEVNLIRLEANWSQQSNVVVLKWIPYSSEELEVWGDHTYVTGIALPDEQRFVDLCLSDDSVISRNLPVLSTDGSQMAFITQYQDRSRFSIFDWQSGEWYLLEPDARGGLIGWATW